MDEARTIQVYTFFGKQNTIPTENERKFVLRLGSESVVSAEASNRSEINQGYLVSTKGITFRVRSISRKNKMQYFFTFKCNTGERILEIENEIDKRDFSDLWEQALNKLEKIRYKLGNGWVADFFKDHYGDTYFAMAECEMPEGQKYPLEIPQVIKDSLVFEVPIEDSRFCSKLLGDIRYAINLFNQISQKNHI